MKNKPNVMRNKLEKLDINNTNDMRELRSLLDKTYEMVSDIECLECRGYYHRLLVLEVVQLEFMLETIHEKTLPVYVEVLTKRDFDPTLCSCETRTKKKDEGLIKIKLLNMYGRY